MSGVNKVILIGYLGKDPELRNTKTGTAVAEFSIAVNENWTDKDGKKQERTEWMSVIAWGKLGEICSKHLSKGRQVYVEGRLQTRSWDDEKGGGKRYKTEVVANTVQFLGGGNGGRRDERDNGDPGPSESDLPF